MFFDYDVPGVGPDETYLIGGDSGCPSFAVVDGKLALLGEHFSTYGTSGLVPFDGGAPKASDGSWWSVDGFLPAYIDQLNTVLPPDQHVSAVVSESSAWKGSGGGNYNLTSNWTNNLVPNGVDAIANFSGTILEPSTVTLNSPMTLGTLIFNSPQSYTLAGPSYLILQTSSGEATIEVLVGSHEISVPVVINSDTIISGAGTLNISGGISGNNTLTVLGNLTATSIQVDTLIIGSRGATAVPEPSILALLGAGALGLHAWVWRRNRKEI